MEIPHGEVKPGEWEVELRRRVDDNLRLRFSDQHGKWGVYEVHRGGAWSLVRWVETKDGQYRKLDHSMIQDALRLDGRRRENGLLSVVDDLRSANERLMKGKREESRKVMHDVRMDAKRELRRIGRHRVFYRPASLRG